MKKEKIRQLVVRSLIESLSIWIIYHGFASDKLLAQLFSGLATLFALVNLIAILDEQFFKEKREFRWFMEFGIPSQTVEFCHVGTTIKDNREVFSPEWCPIRAMAITIAATT